MPKNWIKLDEYERYHVNVHSNYLAHVIPKISEKKIEVVEKILAASS
jgi:hypothetical protein